jgi:hypothetical protein
MQDFI